MKYRITFATVVAAMALNTYVASAEITLVKFDAESEVLTIKGKGDFGGQSIGVEVLKGDVTEESFAEASGDEKFKMLDFVNEIKTSDDSTYNLSFGFSGDSKRHIIRVKTGIKGETETYKIMTVNKTEFDEAFAKINSADDASIKGVLEVNLEILGFDGESFMKLSDTNRSVLALRVLNRRNAQPDKIFAAFSSFEKVYNEEFAVEVVNSADSDNIGNVLDKYEEIFDCKNQKAYDIFKDMSEDEQKQVYAFLAADDFTSVKDVLDGFAYATVNVKLKSVRGYDGLYDLIPGCAEVLNADISKYNALSKENKLKVCSDTAAKLTAGNVTKEILESTLNAAAENYASSGSNNGSLNNGGSSGGSSGGSGGSTPNVAFASSPEIEKEDMFSDLSGVEWAVDCIERLAELNIVRGKADRMFAPNDFVTREEFVKMVVLAFDINAEVNESDFIDVNDGDWYKEYIDRAVGAGIIQGMGDGRFGVGENITRQDIAVILNNVLSVTAAERAYEFDDSAEISDYAKNAVNTMRYLKIISGYEDNTFRPHNNATRAEAAKLLFNAMQTMN